MKQKKRNANSDAERGIKKSIKTDLYSVKKDLVNFAKSYDPIRCDVCNTSSEKEKIQKLEGLFVCESCGVAFLSA